MTTPPHQPKEYPNIALGQCVYEDSCWKLFRQDAGMGETQYSLFRFDIFFCTCDQRHNADYILGLIRSRPSPAPTTTKGGNIILPAGERSTSCRNCGCCDEWDAAVDEITRLVYFKTKRMDIRSLVAEAAFSVRQDQNWMQRHDAAIARQARSEYQQRIEQAIKIANDAVSIVEVLCLSNVSREFTLKEVIPKLKERIALLRAGDPK